MGRNAGQVHECAVGRARSHFEQLSGAKVWRRRKVDRRGSAGVSRMLGRELAGKKKDWLLAHGDAKRASSEEVERDRKRQPCKGGQHVTRKNVVAKRGRAQR